jgi:predicted TIM-barrel fold metal-dependent hydrolase
LTAGDAAGYFVNRMTHAGRMNRIGAFTDFSTDSFFEEIQAAGVTTAVSVSGLNPGAKLGRFDLPPRTTSNDDLARVQRDNPGSFLAVGGIDVSNAFHDALAEIDRCANELNMRAVCIEPGRAPGCLISDERLYPIYEKCQYLDLTMIIQTSGGLGGQYVDYANPKYVEIMAETFPRLRIICGHGCYPYVREAIVMASRRDNVWLSPDGYFFPMGHEDWVRAINYNLMSFSERFLFGSAYPLTAIGLFVENFMKVSWREEVLEKILYRNALKALGLENDPVFRQMYKLDPQ